MTLLRLDYPAKDCETIRGQWKAFEARVGVWGLHGMEPQPAGGTLLPWMMEVENEFLQETTLHLARPFFKIVLFDEKSDDGRKGKSPVYPLIAHQYSQ